MGKYYEGKITRIPVTSPPHGSGTLECENDNLVEEVYITKHDCDNRGIWIFIISSYFQNKRMDLSYSSVPS